MELNLKEMLDKQREINYWTIAKYNFAVKHNDVSSIIFYKMLLAGELRKENNIRIRLIEARHCS